MTISKDRKIDSRIVTRNMKEFYHEAAKESYLADVQEYQEIEEQIDKIEMPEGLDEKIITAVIKHEKKNRKQDIKRAFRRHLAIAAVIVLCFLTISAFLLVNVDAFRVKFFDYLTINREKYSDVKRVETSNDDNIAHIKSLLPEDWENIYYPGQLPRGFEFSKAEVVLLSDKRIYFNDNQDGYIIFSQQLVAGSENSRTQIDSENSAQGELDVNGVKGLWYSKEEWTVLLWTDADTSFMLESSLQIDELKTIAENLIFIK